MNVCCTRGEVYWHKEHECWRYTLSIHDHSFMGNKGFTDPEQASCAMLNMMNSLEDKCRKMMGPETVEAYNSWLYDRIDR